jgi:hypothetical protein
VLGENLPRATLPTTNLTWLDLGSKPGRQCGKPALPEDKYRPREPRRKWLPLVWLNFRHCPYFRNARVATWRWSKGKDVCVRNNFSTISDDIWGSGGTAPPFLTSALDAGEWSASRSCCFIPGERVLGAQKKGGWVGPRVGKSAVEKRIIFQCRESSPGPPVRSLFAIPTEISWLKLLVLCLYYCNVTC